MLRRRAARDGRPLRIGATFAQNINANYRAIEPLRAMERRGHEVIWPDEQGRPSLSRLAGCDVVHVYRRSDDESRDVVAELARRGTAVMWDNDDDGASLPKESPHYRTSGALHAQRELARYARIVKLAAVVTTTTDVIAEHYRRTGVEHTEVIPNALCRGMRRPRVRHDGIVIGWIAGLEHQADADAIPVAAALAVLVRRHPQVRVECIGVDLKLPERYRHDKFVPFSEVPERIGGFDVGIAPLTDIPFNRARSDIKLKEYAASGVPWLASPVGPYVGLGEDQGGRLVGDEEWLDALESLVTQPRLRGRLARKAKSWAGGHTIDATADRWERAFLTAVERAGGSRR